MVIATTQYFKSPRVFSFSNALSMTFCACSIPSSYDFTFALPSAFYEPILAILCQCYKPHRLSAAYPIYANPLQYNSIPSRHNPLLRLRTGLPCLSFTTQFCSIGLLCFSAPLLFLGITNHYHHGSCRIFSLAVPFTSIP